MVDVGKKRTTERSAIARARVRFPRGVLARVLAGLGAKGPVTEVARAAGLLAAKRTGDLIPMCHPLGLDHLEIRFQQDGDVLEIRCKAATRGRTGVEMEALVGAAVAALTVYDMTKGLDHGIAIERIDLLEKRGGRSGHWRRRDGGA
jgi:cyclic pyranopterin phosphate synthase